MKFFAGKEKIVYEVNENYYGACLILEKLHKGNHELWKKILNDLYDLKIKKIISITKSEISFGWIIEFKGGDQPLSCQIQ